MMTSEYLTPCSGTFEPPKLLKNRVDKHKVMGQTYFHDELYTVTCSSLITCPVLLGVS